MLAETMAQRHLTNAAVERLVGVSTGLVSRWLSGERIPSAPCRGKFLDHFQIPFTAWDRSSSP